MKDVIFKNITEFCAAQELPVPENPLFCVGQKELDQEKAQDCISNAEAVSYTNEFYVISLKNIISGEITYGRTKYDSSTGTLLFSAPHQTYMVKDIVVSKESWFIAFHEDYVQGLPIRKLIKSCGFFSYNVNEALHLSPREEHIMKSIFQNIEVEYLNNQDEYSKELIITYLEALLKYAIRFYKRQFLNRKVMNESLMGQFTEMLDTYFENKEQLKNGLPTVEWMANNLNVSHRYLSDTIKAETGKTAIEQINLYVVEEAKNLLLAPNASISETAYALGFEYPQYFSRIFKKKVGMTPKEYIESVESA